MPSPVERIKKFYAEESAGIPKNRQMDGIPVKHKKKDAIVFYYMKGDGPLKLNNKIQNRTRKIVESRLLDEELSHCDFGETYTDENYYYVTVEWWKSLRLRQAILSYRQLIRRVMRIKKTDQNGTKYEFHVLLGNFVEPS